VCAWVRVCALKTCSHALPRLSPANWGSECGPNTQTPTHGALNGGARSIRRLPETALPRANGCREWASVTRCLAPTAIATLLSCRTQTRVAHSRTPVTLKSSRLPRRRHELWVRADKRVGSAVHSLPRVALGTPVRSGYQPQTALKRTRTHGCARGFDHVCQSSARTTTAQSMPVTA
jgi:hypothetical protein